MGTTSPGFNIYRESQYLDLVAFRLNTTQNLPLNDDRILF